MAAIFNQNPMYLLAAQALKAELADRLELEQSNPGLHAVPSAKLANHTQHYIITQWHHSILNSGHARPQVAGVKWRGAYRLMDTLKWLNVYDPAGFCRMNELPQDENLNIAEVCFLHATLRWTRTGRVTPVPTYTHRSWDHPFSPVAGNALPKLKSFVGAWQVEQRKTHVKFVGTCSNCGNTQLVNYTSPDPCDDCGATATSVKANTPRQVELEAYNREVADRKAAEAQMLAEYASFSKQVRENTRKEAKHIANLKAQEAAAKAPAKQVPPLVAVSSVPQPQPQPQVEDVQPPNEHATEETSKHITLPALPEGVLAAPPEAAPQPQTESPQTESGSESDWDFLDFPD